MNAPNSETDMQSFKVSGMSCGLCVGAVTDAIHIVDPAATVEIDLDAGRVSVRTETASPSRIADAITAEGYTVEKLTV